MGLMMSAYFSAILSTADSCLMACSGNVVTDFLYTLKYFRKMNEVRLSQLATLAIGTTAILIAVFMENVLELMLHSYAFMVFGLVLPVLYGLYAKNPSATAAMASMLAGGGITLTLTLIKTHLPFGLDTIIFGLSAALVVLILVVKSKFTLASAN